MQTRIHWTLATLAAIALSSQAFAAHEVWVERAEERGRVLVEARAIFEAIGAQLEWDEATQRVDIIRGDSRIVLYINSVQARVDGREVEMDVPPRVVHGSTRIPLRFVAEALGCGVDYGGDSVLLTRPDEDDILVHFVNSRDGDREVRGAIFLPITSTRYIEDSDMVGMTNWQVTLMRNAIYARYGRVFDNADLRAHFLRQPWYHPRTDFDEKRLSQIERRNAAYLLEYQKNAFGGAADRP
jgi:hypothetical protein